MSKYQSSSSSKNRGEGNPEAARDFNEAEQKFVKSGKVEKAAHDAAKALDGPEAAELEAASKSTAAHARK